MVRREGDVDWFHLVIFVPDLPPMAWEAGHGWQCAYILLKQLCMCPWFTVLEFTKGHLQRQQLSTASSSDLEPHMGDRKRKRQFSVPGGHGIRISLQEQTMILEAGCVPPVAHMKMYEIVQFPTSS